MIRLGLSCICECVQILKVQFVVCSSLHIKQNKQVFGLNNSVFVPMTQKNIQHLVTMFSIIYTKHYIIIKIQGSNVFQVICGVILQKVRVMKL